jgi:hypothetical protein
MGSSLRVRDGLRADSASYNMLMTTMLRAEVGSSVWGNWTLDHAVEPGMVGVLDPVAGTFERHKRGAIPLEVEVVEDHQPSSWSYRSESVSHREADTASGRAESWRFEESHTIASRGTHAVRRRLADPTGVARDQYDLIRRWADVRGYATDDGIVQGFGLITATYEASDVVNLASREPGQEFVLNGSWERAGNLEAFVHPGPAGGPAPATVPYAFEFLSFAGSTALPAWLGQIPAITVSFHNTGSYVVQCTVAYDTPGGRDHRKRIQVGCRIPGWAYLPLDATNVRVTCRFWHVDDWGPKHQLRPVSRPMEAWQQGQGVVEIEGWWPGDYEADWVR